MLSRILGTAAPAADANLILQMVMGVALVTGAVLARIKKYTARTICQEPTGTSPEEDKPPRSSPTRLTAETIDKPGCCTVSAGRRGATEGPCLRYGENVLTPWTGSTSLVSNCPEAAFHIEWAYDVLRHYHYRTRQARRQALHPGAANYCL